MHQVDVKAFKNLNSMMVRRKMRIRVYLKVGVVTAIRKVERYTFKGDHVIG